MSILLFLVLLDYNEEILALVPASNVRVDVGRMFALQTTIRTLKLGLAATRSAQMCVEGALVLVAL